MTVITQWSCYCYDSTRILRHANAIVTDTNKPDQRHRYGTAIAGLTASLLLSACLNPSPENDPVILEDPISKPSDLNATPLTADLSNDLVAIEPAPTLDISIQDQTLLFDWESPVGSVITKLLTYNTETDSYELLASIDNGATAYSMPVDAHTLNWRTVYVLEHCAADDCLRSRGTILSNVSTADGNDSAGRWITSDISKPYDALGSATALALNGRVMVTGAPGRDVLDTRSGNFISDAGAIHVFYAIDNRWTEVALLSADAPVEDAGLGSTLDISFDGDTVVSSTDSTALIFERFGEGYVQTASFDYPAAASELIASGKRPAANISRDGDTVIVSVPNTVDSQGYSGGQVYVYKRIDGQWSQTDTLESFEPMAGLDFGQSMALSASGSRIFISATTADQDSQTAVSRVYIFEATNGRYAPAGIITDLNAQGQVNFGHSIASSDSGDTLLVSRSQAPTPANDGSQTRTKSVAGIVIYEQDETEQWTVKHYLIPAGNHSAGSQIQLSSNQDASVVSAALTDPVTAVTGVSTWVKSGELYQARSLLVNPDNDITGFADNFVLSSDGKRLAVGAPLRKESTEDSTRLFAGAVRVY